MPQKDTYWMYILVHPIYLIPAPKGCCYPGNFVSELP